MHSGSSETKTLQLLIPKIDCTIVCYSCKITNLAYVALITKLLHCPMVVVKEGLLFYQHSIICVNDMPHILATSYKIQRW